MKRLLAVFILVLVALACVGQEIVYTENPTVEWDAVTAYADLTPFDPADIVEYQLFRADPATHTNQVAEGLTALTSMAVVVPSGGPWAYGVRTVLTTDGGITVLYSTMAWSDVEGTPSPFVYKQHQTMLPQRPTGLRTQ